MFTKKMKLSAISAVCAAVLLAGCGNADSGSTAQNSSASAFDKTSSITVISREDGSGTRGAFIELFEIEQKNDDSILEEVVEKTPKNHARTSPLLEEFRRQRAENKKVNTKIENAQHYKTLQEQKTETINKTADLKDLKCFVNNKSYEVLSTTNLENNIGCHLAKNNDSYAVLGYVGDNICILKEYETLKSQKIQSRIYKKISDTVTQYLIRIGNKKFIINVKADFIEHVLDLC